MPKTCCFFLEWVILNKHDPGVTAIFDLILFAKMNNFHNHHLNSPDMKWHHAKCTYMCFLNMGPSHRVVHGAWRGLFIVSSCESTALITSYATVNFKKGEMLQLLLALFNSSLDRGTSEVPNEMWLVLLQRWKFSLGALENQWHSPPQSCSGSDMVSCLRMT